MPNFDAFETYKWLYTSVLVKEQFQKYPPLFIDFNWFLLVDTFNKSNNKLNNQGTEM